MPCASPNARQMLSALSGERERRLVIPEHDAVGHELPQAAPAPGPPYPAGRSSTSASTRGRFSRPRPRSTQKNSRASASLMPSRHVTRARRSVLGAYSGVAPLQRRPQVVVLPLQPIEPVGLLAVRAARLGRSASARKWSTWRSRRPWPRRSPPAAPARTRGSSPASRSAARRPSRSAWRSRLLSTSDARPSSTSMPEVAIGVADRLGRLQRAAADEHRQPPEQRLLAGRRAGRSSRRSRRAASAGGPAGRARRRSAAAAVAPAAPAAPAGESSLIRAAASSIASGRPSSRRQISATAGAFSSVTAKSGLIAAARSTNSATAAYCDSALERRQSLRGRAAPAAAPRYSCSPRSCSGARLVTSTLRPRAGRQQLGHDRRGRAGPARSCRAPAAAACSRRYSLQARPATGRPPTSRTPERLGDRRRRPGRDREIGARSTKKTPSANWSSRSAATWSARRVLPVPPGPVSVSRRTSVAQQQLAHGRPPRARARAAASAGSAGCAGGRRAMRSGGKSAGRSGRDELEDALRADQVLEAMLAQVAQARRRRAARRGPGRASPRESRTWPPWPVASSRAHAVERRAVVVAVALLGRAGVQRHPHPQRADLAPRLGLEPALGVQRRRDARPGRGRTRRGRRRPSS